MKTLSFEIDGDGIALITLNDPTKPMNVVSPEWIEELIATIERVAADPSVKGAVITSSKPAFMAGADLKYIYTLSGGAITAHQAFEFSQRPSIPMHRRLETCGKPFVAAINGLALGGGYELALACHYRVIADDPKAVVGLPEVTVGLLPGSGGTQRLPRMIGIEKSLPILLEGKPVGPAEALKLGMVDAVVPAGHLIETARQWILKSPDPVRAWDKKGYRSSGGLLNSTIANAMTFAPAAIAAKTQYNYPAPIAILDCIFEGTMMPFDKALRLESKYFAKLLCDPVSRNLIRTTFINKGEAMKLARRPKDVPQSRVNKLGVLGAGMMGAGIAYVSAAAGIEVVLLDSGAELADCSPKPLSAARSRKRRPMKRWRASKRRPIMRTWRSAISSSKPYSRTRRSKPTSRARRRRSFPPLRLLRAIPRRCPSPDLRNPPQDRNSSSGCIFSRPSTACRWSKSSWGRRPVRRPWQDRWISSPSSR
jgi:3-hydroxyacyl-CoA dehydrogenase/enoyl-CoA hydratase/3-hydroxybutyryl-CoA epimerase